MNFQHITDNKAFRVSVNGRAVTARKKAAEVSGEGKTPESYVKEVLESLGISRCTVEYFRPNGNSMVKDGQFEYQLSGVAHPSAPTKGIPLGGAFQGMVYTGHEALLAKQYEKWYNEECDKNRGLRTELEQTARELNKARIDLQLLEMRKQLEVERKELALEKESKSGLNGLADTIEKYPFLQGLLDKIVDNFSNANKSNSLESIDDVEIQQAITEATQQFIKLATHDREHFACVALATDKLSADKEMARYIYKWMNTPSENPAPDTTA